jgi:hypothetical protein
MAKGIPDAAWEPIEGDDKKVASALKKRTRSRRSRGLDALGSRARDERRPSPSAVAALDAARDDDPKPLAGKERQWTGILSSEAYRHQKLTADAWCAAFVWPKQPGPCRGRAHQRRVAKAPRRRVRAAATTKTVEELAEQYRFFHWHLQFPRSSRRAASTWCWGTRRGSA